MANEIHDLTALALTSRDTSQVFYGDTGAISENPHIYSERFKYYKQDKNGQFLMFLPSSDNGLALTLKLENYCGNGVTHFRRAGTEYLSVADNANLSVSNQDFTVAAWVWLDSKSIVMYAADQYDQNVAPDRSWRLFYSVGSDRLQFSIRSFSAEPTVDWSAAPSTGQWYFVVAWHEQGVGINIQVNDGTPVSAAHATGVQNSSVPLRIGVDTRQGDVVSPSAWDGRIAAVGFWKRILTSGERTTLYNSGTRLLYASLSAAIKTSLQAYWNLNDRTEQRNDSHGTNHLTQSNRPELLADAGTVIHTLAGGSITSQKYSFQVTTGERSTGTYVVRATVASSPTEITGLFDVDATVDNRQSFPGAGVLVTAQPQSRLTSTLYPCRISLPLPVGAVEDVSTLRLYDGGTVLPGSFLSRATWGPNGTTRWAHGVGLFRWNGNTPSLTVKNSGTEANHPVTLNVTNAASYIEVDNGWIKFKVSKTAFAGIEELYFDPTGQRSYGDRIVNGATGGPYVIDNGGTTYASHLDAAPTVEVEEQSRNHVIIRAAGIYTSGGATTLCKFETRLEAFAGLSFVTVRQGCTIDFDTDTIQLKDVGFKFETGQTVGMRYTVGYDGTFNDGTAGAVGQSKYAYQYKHANAKLLRSPTPTIEATKLDGYATLYRGTDADNSHRLTVYAKHVWEKFPKQFTYKHTHLTFHQVPANLEVVFSDDTISPGGARAQENLFKFWCFHQADANGNLDLDLPSLYVNDPAPTAFDLTSAVMAETNQVTSADLGKAAGVVIFDEFVVLPWQKNRLSSNPLFNQESDLLNWCRLWQDDPLAMPRASWNADSKAMGDIADDDGENFQDVEESIHNGFVKWKKTASELAEAYGMFNFGDQISTWQPVLGYPAYHRIWHSDHYHDRLKAWLLFCRGKHEDLLQAAREGQRQYCNINVCNDATGGPGEGHSYHGKGCTHWGFGGGDAAGIAEHFIDPESSLFAWLIDQDRRAKKVWERWNAISKTNVFALGTGFSRDSCTTLANIISSYETNLDASYIPYIQGIARAGRATSLSSGTASLLWHPLWINYYYEYTRDPDFLTYIADQGINENYLDCTAFAYNALGFELLGGITRLSQYYDDLNLLRFRLYHNASDTYNNYGMASGPLTGGSNWKWMGWPRLRKALERQNLTDVPATTAANGYPIRTSNPGGSTIGCDIRVRNASSSSFNIIATILAANSGDRHLASLDVFDPDGTAINISPSQIFFADPDTTTWTISTGKAGWHRLEWRQFIGDLTAPLTSLDEIAIFTANAQYKAAKMNLWFQPRNGIRDVQVKFDADAAFNVTRGQHPTSYRIYSRTGQLLVDGSLLDGRTTTATHTLNGDDAPWNVILYRVGRYASGITWLTDDMVGGSLNSLSAWFKGRSRRQQLRRGTRPKAAPGISSANSPSRRARRSVKLNR